ncbi:hypothetical protein F5888DRAFT_1699740 [Russula emetica]|nr:hypothetical protein F5888DRAFT_1699740 [Russula emetica]
MAHGTDGNSYYSYTHPAYLCSFKWVSVSVGLGVGWVWLVFLFVLCGKTTQEAPDTVLFLVLYSWGLLFMFIINL